MGKRRWHGTALAVGGALAPGGAVEEAAGAEAARRHTCECLTHAQPIAPVGEWECDTAGDVVTWSGETYRIFGLVPEEGPISYERYLALIHRDDRDTVGRAVSRTLETGEPFEIDHRIIRPDGSLRFLHGRGGIVRDGAGRPTRLIGAVLDITARKQAEEALRQASDHLQAIIQSSPLAILSLDAERIVQTWNPAAERLFGWPAKEVVGRPVPIVPEEKEEECREARRRVLQGQLFTGVELIRRKKDGSAVTGNGFAAPLPDVEGRVAGILAVIEDVTAMKRLEQQFFQALQMEAAGAPAGGAARRFYKPLSPPPAA